MAFDSRKVRKIYHAILIGAPHWDEYLVDLPLRPDGDRRHRTVIEARPETGRTHQIRAPLAAIDLPLVGDELYGRKGATALIARTALHAHTIQLEHPATHQPLHVEAPYPPDFTQALRQLRGQ